METEISSSLRRHLILAFGTIFLLVGGLGTVASVIKINSAVIATGRVVVESNVKRVQHQEGGTVREIHVSEGQSVDPGDLLVRMDDTLQKATVAIINKRLYELWSQQVRLTAERDGRVELVIPKSLAATPLSSEFFVALEGQRMLLSARMTSRKSRKDQLVEQIKQFDEQIVGLTVQREAKAEEIRLVAQELDELSGLLNKGLIERSRITALKREKAKLEGDRGRFVAAIAQSARSISEKKGQTLQVDEDMVDEDMRAEVVEQLQAARAETAELEEQKVAVMEQLDRVEIEAPRSGFIHQLSVHTVGGVVSPSEDLMTIVPEEDLLIIEAQISPTDIDQIATDQEATIRLSRLDQRSTPELKAKVLNVSADLIHDAVTGLSYYKARLALDEQEIDRLEGQSLVPGLPVEAFVQSEARTILSCLIKPLAEQRAHTFREG